MKRILVCLLLAGAGAGLAQEGVDLAALEGWDLVLAEDAIASEAYAAKEFQSFLAAAGGPALPVVSRPDRPDRHVFIGPGRAMRESAVGFGADGLGPEDLRIVVRDRNIAIAGGRPRGTLYGVYTFLEDYLGVRFLTADHTHVPRLGEWRRVGPLDRVYRPPLAFRWGYYGEINADPAFAARMRVNTVTGSEELGGATGLGNINHSLYGQAPSRRYGADHPEYYALVDGARRNRVAEDGGGEGTQVCATNPEVLGIVTRAVLDALGRTPRPENVSVSQNDNFFHCRCARCAAVDEREGSAMGSLLALVNAVAGGVAAAHPDAWIGTLSYQYSRRPPRALRPAPNVQIQLCSIECCLLHPIADPDCPLNAPFCRDLADWGRVCDKITIWNYNTDFSNYLLPCPNLFVIEPNIRFFVANHARGLFMQAAGNARGAEFSELRSYLICRLLWDPNQSGERLLDEFLTLHYPGAAPAIRQFINLVHERALRLGLHAGCFARAEHYGVDESVAEAGLDAFAAGRALAENDAVRARVDKASVCAYRAALEPVWYERDPANVDPAVAARLRPVATRFLELCRDHGVTMTSEGETIQAARERLAANLGLVDAPAP